MSLIEQIERRAADGTDEESLAWQTLREVLPRDADPRKGDDKKLDAAMKTLKCTVDDLRIYKATMEAEEADKDLDERFKAAQHEQSKAAIAFNDYRAESEKVIIARETEEIRLKGVLAGKTIVINNLERSRERRRDRHRAFWRLLGICAPPVETDLNGVMPPRPTMPSPESLRHSLKDADPQAKPKPGPVSLIPAGIGPGDPRLQVIDGVRMYCPNGTPQFGPGVKASTTPSAGNANGSGDPELAEAQRMAAHIDAAYADPDAAMAEVMAADDTESGAPEE